MQTASLVRQGAQRVGRVSLFRALKYPDDYPAFKGVRSHPAVASARGCRLDLIALLQRLTLCPLCLPSSRPDVHHVIGGESNEFLSVAAGDGSRCALGGVASARRLHVINTFRRLGNLLSWRLSLNVLVFNRQRAPRRVDRSVAQVHQTGHGSDRTRCRQQQRPAARQKCLNGLCFDTDKEDTARRYC